MTFINTLNTRRNAFNLPAGFDSLEKQLDSIFGSFPALFELEPSTSLFSNQSPNRVRWYEKDDAYLVRLDLPGVQRDAITLEAENGQLKVAAKRTEQTTGDSDAAFAYEKSFKLPEEVEVAKITATYQDGVLSLRLPKGEKAKARRIAVK